MFAILFYKASAGDVYVMICYSVYSSSDPYLSVSALELLTSTDQGSNMQYNSGNDSR